MLASSVSQVIATFRFAVCLENNIYGHFMSSDLPMIQKHITPVDLFTYRFRGASLSQVFLYVPLAEIFWKRRLAGCKERMQIRYPQNHQKSPDVSKEQYLVCKKTQHFYITI